MAHHRVELVQVIDAHLDDTQRHVHFVRHDLLVGFVVRDKLVQRWVEQADGHRQAAHFAEKPFEVGALHRQQLGERLAAAGFVLGENHFAHRLDPVAFEEHVLGAAEADSLGAEVSRHFGVFRRVGVGPDAQPLVAIGKFHQGAEVAGQLGFLGRHLAEENVAGRAVERDPVAFVPRLVADRHRPCPVVDVHRSRAGNAALAHAARNHGGVRSHPAAGGQDALGHAHAAQVFR